MAFHSTHAPSYEYITRLGDQGIALGNNTLAAWVRFDDLSDVYEVIEINDTTGTWFPPSAGITLDPGADKILYSQLVGSSGAGVTALGATTLSAGTWYHVAMTWDGSTLVGYLNGVQDATNSGSVGARGNWKDLQVGPALGDLQDGVFYDVALSAAEIAQLYRNRLPARRQNLFCHMPCFPGSANRLIDYSGNARDFTDSGTPVDATTWPQAPWGDDGGVMILDPDGATQSASGGVIRSGSAAAGAAAAGTGDVRGGSGGASTRASGTGDVRSGSSQAGGLGIGGDVRSGSSAARAAGGGTGDIRSGSAGASTRAAGTGDVRSGTAFPGAFAIGGVIRGGIAVNDAPAPPAGGGAAFLAAASVASNRRHSLAFGARRRMR